ncbi:MAG: DNA-processing protein DprA [Pirellulaceae bacterium]
MNETAIQPIDDEARAIIQLSLTRGIGPRLLRGLLEQFGSAREALRASPEQLRSVEGIGPQLVRAICTSAEQVDVDRLLAQCENNQITIKTLASPDYPRTLQEIYDPPNLLFEMGRWEEADQLAVAIVGSRHATTYGLKQAERFARGLSLAGFTVVSGLARGIDQAAHRGALAAGGRTIAVLGSGLLNIYPPEHDSLAREIAAAGCVFSELEPEHSPKGAAFPQRNRIVTGLSLGTIVIEASERSGALISARLAMEQGREVYAMPGRVDSRMSRGCHRLIRDGAKLVETVDDVLEELGPLAMPVRKGDAEVIHHPAELKLNEQEGKVLNAIGTEPTPLDEVVATSGVPVHRVLSTISVLEMKRLIQRIGQSSVCRR